MNTKRLIILTISVILLSIPVGLGASIYFRYYQQQKYDKIRFANALYDPITIDKQKQILEVYEKRLGIDFPDSTRILFANAEKGDLLEITYFAVLKLKIDDKDSETFEKALQKKYKNASAAERDAVLNWYYAPGKIWTPKSLKEYQVYSIWSQMSLLCLGLDTRGNTIIYLYYATI